MRTFPALGPVAALVAVGFSILAPTPYCPSALADVAKDIGSMETTLKACEDKDSSNSNLKFCTAKAGEMADKVLNQIYKSITEKLRDAKSDNAEDNKETLKRLIAAERSWLAYREAECLLQGTQMLGGSGEGLIVSACYYSLTTARIKDLDDLFQQK